MKNTTNNIKKQKKYLFSKGASDNDFMDLFLFIWMKKKKKKLKSHKKTH